LVGLITMAEQRRLLKARGGEQSLPRILQPGHPVSEKFNKICPDPTDGSLAARMRLLEIFVEALAEELKAAPQEDAFEDPARARMEKLLGQLPMAALVDLRMDQLVEQLGCTPRHVSRLFHQVVGTCFRNKQSEVRFLRARELLATTNIKILDVAMNSGFQSVTLFNTMFKKRFGCAPSEWRQRFKQKGIKWRPVDRQLLRV
jgi:AraC-like DNA-binding protein